MLAFNLEQEKLLKPLLLMAGVIDKRQGFPILSNILIKAEQDYLQLNATDTEIEMVTRIKWDSAPEALGEITLEAKKLIDICRSFESGNELFFNLKENKMTIKSGKSRFNLATLAAKEFPYIKNDQKNIEFSIKTNNLRDLLGATGFCMAHQDVRYYLNGLLLDFSSDFITSVATDGHRLAICETENTTDLRTLKVMLPRKGVVELIKLLDHIEEEEILISVSEHHFYVDSANYTFITKLLSGKFPNYGNAIPTNNDKIVVIERDILKRSLSRVAILSNEKFKGVRLELLTDSLKIAANNPDQEEAEEELEAEISGGKICIGFNVIYLLDVLSNVAEGKVKLSFSTPESSMLIESVENQETKYIIMPMKI